MPLTALDRQMRQRHRYNALRSGRHGTTGEESEKKRMATLKPARDGYCKARERATRRVDNTAGLCKHRNAQRGCMNGSTRPPFMQRKRSRLQRQLHGMQRDCSSHLVLNFMMRPSFGNTS